MQANVAIPPFANGRGGQSSSATRRPSPGTPVAVHRTTHAGKTVPTFGQDVWDLSCIDMGLNDSPPVLHFARFKDAGHKRIAKELIWQRLNVPVASCRREGKTKQWDGETCSKALDNIHRLLVHLAGLGVVHLHEVEQRHLDDFMKAVLQDATSAQHKAMILKAADLLHESGAHLTGGGIRFLPWAATASSTTALMGVRKPPENLTARIPEAVLRDLLRWALAYVDHFAADIIAAARSYHGHGTPGTTLLMGEAAAAFQDWVGREVVGRGVPGTMHIGKLKPAVALIAARAGVSQGWLTTSGRAPLDEAVDTHGLQERFLPVKATTTPRTQTWREPMSVVEMKEECRRLTIACYIVTAYLSGMRDGEVQALERDCLEVLRDADGTPFRIHLNGLAADDGEAAGPGDPEEPGEEPSVQDPATDGEGKPPRLRLHGRTFKHLAVPKKVSWVVVDPVRRAIEVLRDLTADFHEKTRDPHLFVRLHTETKSSYLLKEGINDMIREFADHCSGSLAPRLGEGAQVGDYPLVVISAGPKGPWHLKSSQFRRTIAWHIANRPFGLIAGMIQYKHAHIQMFEGYAGRAGSGFQAEVRQERADAAREDVVEMFSEAKRGLLPTGPMGAELRAIFKVLAKEAGPFQGTIAKGGRADQLLRKTAGRYHPGALADCIYDPADARCQETAPASMREGPIATLCDPDCPSACWRHKHLANWSDLRAETMRLRGLNQRISPLQRKILDDSLRKVDQRIAAIKEASGG